MGIGRGAGTLWQCWVYRGWSQVMKRYVCNWRRREGLYTWRKRDRGWNQVSRRHSWITDVTRVPVWPHYSGLSPKKAKSVSSFDT
jgi:hypothetical protein